MKRSIHKFFIFMTMLLLCLSQSGQALDSLNITRINQEFNEWGRIYDLLAYDDYSYLLSGEVIGDDPSIIIMAETEPDSLIELRGICNACIRDSKVISDNTKNISGEINE